MITKNHSFKIIIFTVLSGFFSCTEKPSDREQLPDKDSLIRMNKELVFQENKRIESYIERMNTSFQITGTGLRYAIVKQGNGTKPKPLDRVLINYKVSLLGGKVLYTSEDGGPRVFWVERDEVESAIHEAVQLMNLGAKGIFISPSHLGFGLLGDRAKIPPGSSLIYELELLEIQQNDEI